MNITCNKCGATYKIDPNKIIAPRVRFKCKTCGNHISIHKDQIISDASSQAFTLQPEVSHEPADAAETKIKGFGIRFKLFFFLIILIGIFGLQAYYLILQLNKTADRFGKQGTQIIKEMAENDIMKTARSVAKQVKLYIEAHPELTKEQFMTDQQFQQIAVQKVGKKGYTALYGKESDGKWRTRAHIRPNICAPALDDMAKLKKPLGVNFPEFWNILTAVKSEQPSKGYYKWQEKDKSFKNKYMACVNVTGTRFNIASTTYMDDFTEPMQRLERESRAIAKAETIKSAILSSVIILIIAIIVFIFGGRLTANIKYLSEMTDRISLGDLDALIEIRSKDELAVLAESISRLQQSVKLFMQRLYKK
ncbi:MAG: zinc-ribbon domain-containing protein [Desulfobacula sp.]|uniref:HAMP domain-containing protein n=1 Tax=Desulfobacula sp. TaxID=2593537 RepID=UPI0025C56428|nr:zinc-ribbon domain-containing protein [Desulfobacula sp.]MCD4721508.1 zinc-ribbon domain-containing protein [Desulfobacula sp.]